MGRQGTALASSMGRPTTGEAAFDDDQDSYDHEDDYVATSIGRTSFGRFCPLFLPFSAMKKTKQFFCHEVVLYNLY